jgi:hypothetical protein
VKNDSLRNSGFNNDNIFIKPENLTQLIFILYALDMKEKTLIQSINLIKYNGFGLSFENYTNAYLLTKEKNEIKLNSDNKYTLILAQLIFEEDKIIKDAQKETTKFLTNRSYLNIEIKTNKVNKIKKCLSYNNNILIVDINKNNRLKY